MEAPFSLSKRKETVTKQALIIVDKEGALYLGESARQIIPKIKELAQKMRKPASPAGGQGAAIIYLTDSHQPDDRGLQLFPPHCVKKTPGAQVI